MGALSLEENSRPFLYVCSRAVEWYQKHIRCDISDSSNARISGIAFRSVETILGKTILKNNNMHVIGKLKLSEWNGREQVQMHIMDAIKF